MKRKLKLAFEQLERELSVLPQEDLMQILGGNSSGLNEDSTVDEIVDHFTSLGMQFTEDSQGNYFFGSSGTTGSPIMLDEVNVYASSSGSGGSSGSSGSNSVEDIFVNYFEQFGFMFGAAGGGGGGGGGGNGSNYVYIGYDKQDDNDPWLRDSNGNIIVYRPPVGPETYSYILYGNVSMNVEKVILKMADGSEVIAYEVFEVWDGNLGITRPPTEAEMSNCFGRVLADGKYWFWDNHMSATDEFAGFVEMFGDANSTDSIYVECPKSEATMAMIYSDSALTNPIHAGTYDPATDTYYAKGGVSPANTYYSEAEFRVTNAQGQAQYAGILKYYKLRN